MSSPLYETLIKFRAARDGGLDITMDDMLHVVAKDPFIDLDALYDRVIDYANRRKSEERVRWFFERRKPVV